MLGELSSGQAAADVTPPGLTVVSCAAELLYPSGHLPPEIAQSPDGRPAISAVDCGFETTGLLFAASSYRWSLSENALVAQHEHAEVIRTFCAGMPIRTAPASALVRMDNVTLVGGVLYGHADGKPVTIYETCRPNDLDVVWRAPLDKVLAPNRRTFAVDGWRCFFLSSAGSFNYGHWLVDDLPRLKGVLLLMAQEPGPIRVIIESFGTAIDSVRVESIRSLLQQPIHVDLVARHESFHFRTLYYPSPVSQHPILKSPSALDFLARRAIGTVDLDLSAQGRSDHLFVGRSEAHGRTLTNGIDVRALMASRGFRIVDPEGMSFDEQVRLFAGASIVIGQMGAAMTNTVFCRPTTTLLYLAPLGWIEPFYFDLAMARGHDYRVLYGPVADAGVMPHQSDFVVPIDLLSACLDTLGF